MRALLAVVCALAVGLAGVAPAEGATKRTGQSACAPIAKTTAPAKAKARANTKANARSIAKAKARPKKTAPRSRTGAKTTLRKAAAKRRCRRPAAKRKPLAAPPAATPALRPAVRIDPLDPATAPGPAAVAAPAPGSSVAPPAVSVPGAPGTTPAAPPVPAPAPLPPCDLTTPWLGVVAEDANGAFRLRVSRTCVPAGRVYVDFRNVDLQPHNLYAEGIAPAAPRRRVVDDLDGETSTTAAVDLAPGTWRLLCTIPGHEAMQQVVSARG